MKKVAAALDRGVLAFMAAAEQAIDRGYISAWFSWLEWTAVTSLILAIGARNGSWLLLALGTTCAVLLVLVGLVALERVKAEHMKTRAGTASTSMLAAIITAFGTGAIYLMTNAMMELLPSMGGN